MPTQFETCIKGGEDSFSVAKECAKEAFTKLNVKNVSLCIIFASVKYNFDKVILGVRSVIGPEAQIIGASSCGEFNEEIYLKDSISVGLIYSEEYLFKVECEQGLKEDVNAVFERLKSKFNNFLSLPGKTSSLMTIDGLCGIGEEATLSAMAVFQTDMKIVGGAAGDSLKFKETKVIANDKVMSNAVAFCLIKGPEFLFTGVSHGHVPLSETLLATRANANILYEINNRPAWEVWKEKAKDAALKLNINVDALNDASSQGTFLLQFELGFETPAGYKIRAPLSVGCDGSLGFACTIPEGVKFKIMTSSKSSLITSANTAAKSAVKLIDKSKIAGAIVFDCVCRAICLNDNGFLEAIKAIKNEIGMKTPMLGFTTYGEICMDPDKFSGFHNTTSVIALILK